MGIEIITQTTAISLLYICVTTIINLKLFMIIVNITNGKIQKLSRSLGNDVQSF